MKATAHEIAEVLCIQGRPEGNVCRISENLQTNLETFFINFTLLRCRN